jgi:parallel beta-helix repeat protein
MLTGCKIHGSIHGCGVCVFQGGKGELNENEIYQNAMSGVEIFGEETEIEVRANRIHSNRGDGVLVYDSGKCTLTSNTIEKNFHAGNLTDFLGLAKGG